MCLPEALRPDNTPIVWKLDRSGHVLRHLINTVYDLTSHGTTINTTTATGKLVFVIFAALAEFVCEMIAERAIAILASAGSRERKVDNFTR